MATGAQSAANAFKLLNAKKEEQQREELPLVEDKEVSKYGDEVVEEDEVGKLQPLAGGQLDVVELPSRPTP